MPLTLSPQRVRAEPWPPVLAVRGPGALRTLHYHHAMHFVLALHGELKVRTARTGGWKTAAGVLTAPDRAHTIDARGVDMLVIFFDPESDSGAILRTAVKGAVRFISSTERNELTRGIDDPSLLVNREAEVWSKRAATTLGLVPDEHTRVIHPAVRRLLRQLRASGPEDDHSLGALAQMAGLSNGRLMHVFSESIGIPLRPYLSWLRAQRAACAIFTGATLTEAAHAAGFADASHLNRTFKRQFGMNPSALRTMTRIR